MVNSVKRTVRIHTAPARSTHWSKEVPKPNSIARSAPSPAQPNRSLELSAVEVKQLQPQLNPVTAQQLLSLIAQRKNQIEGENDPYFDAIDGYFLHCKERILQAHPNKESVGMDDFAPLFFSDLASLQPTIEDHHTPLKQYLEYLPTIKLPENVSNEQAEKNLELKLKKEYCASIIYGFVELAIKEGMSKKLIPEYVVKLQMTISYLDERAKTLKERYKTKPIPPIKLNAFYRHIEQLKKIKSRLESAKCENLEHYALSKQLANAYHDSRIALQDFYFGTRQHDRFIHKTAQFIVKILIRPFKFLIEHLPEKLQHKVPSRVSYFFCQRNFLTTQSQKCISRAYHALEVEQAEYALENLATPKAKG